MLFYQGWAQNWAHSLAEAVLLPRTWRSRWMALSYAAKTEPTDTGADTPKSASVPRQFPALLVVLLRVHRHSRRATRPRGAGSQWRCRCLKERIRTRDDRGRGGVPDSDRGERNPRFGREKFPAGKIFFACCFSGKRSPRRTMDLDPSEGSQYERLCKLLNSDPSSRHNP